MNTEIVSHIESNAESNAMVILRKKTKQNKKPKFDETTEFRQFDIGLHKVFSRIQQTKKRFNNLKAWSSYERIVIVPWIQAWS